MIAPYFEFTAGHRRWQESLVVGRRYIQYALHLGSPLIRTCAGRIASADMSERDWEACISGLKALTSLPGAEQVVFALECHPNRPEDTIDSVLREIEEVGADNLKVLLQPTSFIAQADTQEILDALYQHTVHIHAGLRSEEVDWEWMLPEMAQRGYDGFLSLEGVEEPKLQAIERTIDWLREIVPG
jgi:3-dehydroshikimate dehydratase